jgi:hypothetical protein
MNVCFCITWGLLGETVFKATDSCFLRKASKPILNYSTDINLGNKKTKQKEGIAVLNYNFVLYCTKAVNHG